MGGREGKDTTKENYPAQPPAPTYALIFPLFQKVNTDSAICTKKPPKFLMDRSAVLEGPFLGRKAVLLVAFRHVAAGPDGPEGVVPECGVDLGEIFLVPGGGGLLVGENGGRELDEVKKEGG